jgi:Kef-type K+ transport system membrane component KefB/Trk K+ transport system NAD-binding subunit
MEFSILNLLLVLLAAWIGGQVARKMGYPTVLGEIMAGVLLGPALLGVLHSSAALGVLAEVGILLMMLYIGMEIDPKELGKASFGGILAALGGFIVPFLLGFWVVGLFGGSTVAGMFVGMAMGVTSLATKSRILVDLKILDTRISHVMLAGALIADTLSLVIFAGILSFATAGSFQMSEIAVIGSKVTAFFAVSWLAGTILFPRLYRFLKEKGLTGRTFNATLVLLIALAFAELAHLAGLHGILGAFIAGIFLRGAIEVRKLSHELAGLVKDVSLGFLAPIFFVTAGFQVSFEVFQTDLALLLSIIVLATLGKIVGTALFYLPSGNGWREGVTIGAGMNGRGAVEIVVAGIGLQAGIIDQTIFSILVFMAIATTATVPVFLKWGVKWLERRGELQRSTDLQRNVVIVGAGVLSRFIARTLSHTKSVVLVDSNEENVAKARELGLTAIHGDAIDPDVLHQAGVEKVGKLLAFTPNPEVNAFVIQRAREDYFVPELYAALDKSSRPSLLKIASDLDATILTSMLHTISDFERRFDSHLEFGAEEIQIAQDIAVSEITTRDELLPLILKRNGDARMIREDDQLRKDDIVVGVRRLGIEPLPG